MRLENAFKEIFTGLNINTKTSLKSNDYKEYNTFLKEALQYSRILDNKIKITKVYCDVKDKYFMKDRDIIISLRKPYKVGTYLKSPESKKILIQNNFAILRGIDMEKYSFIFVSNYLERIGINKFLEGKENDSFSLEDIKNIELPDIPKEEQMKISKLMNSINERSCLYSKILENDDQIIKEALNRVIGGNNV